MLKSTVFLLHGQTDNSLTRIDRLFLDSDQELGVGEWVWSMEACHGRYVLQQLID